MLREHQFDRLSAHILFFFFQLLFIQQNFCMWIDKMLGQYVWAVGFYGSTEINSVWLQEELIVYCCSHTELLYMRTKNADYDKKKMPIEDVRLLWLNNTQTGDRKS